MRDADEFGRLMAEVTTGRFGHREHVHLTWLAIRRHGESTARRLINDGIRQTTRYSGAPQKYHVTISEAWVQLIGHHVAHAAGSSFDSFAAANPALLDKRLLARFYSTTTLAGAAARTGWVPPDREPFPWCHSEPPAV